MKKTNDIKKISKFKIQPLIFLLMINSQLLISCKPFGPDDSSSSPVERCETSVKKNLQDQFDLSESLPSNKDLFTDVPYVKNSNPRERLVQINVKELQRRLLSHKQHRLNIPLLSNYMANAAFEKVEIHSNNNLVAMGTIPGEDLSSVTLVINHEVLLVNIHLPNREVRFEISYLGSGLHKIRSLSALDSDENPDDCLTDDILHADYMPFNNQDYEVETSNLNLLSLPTIDVLVAYTTAAKNSLGGEDAIKSLIQMGIADSNKAYQQSGALLNIRLVGTYELSQKENSFSSDLSYLKGTSDGKWDMIHSERRRLGADLVALVAYYPDSSIAGIGYVGSTYTTGFSITKTTAFKQFSFTHEIGHNMGLRHPDGYVNSSGRFRTVMAYGSYPRIGRFSNPEVNYGSFLTGSSAQNSTRLLNSNASRIAQLMNQVVDIEEPTVSQPVLDPGDGSSTPIEACVP